MDEQGDGTDRRSDPLTGHAITGSFRTPPPSRTVQAMQFEVLATDFGGRSGRTNQRELFAVTIVKTPDP